MILSEEKNATNELGLAAESVAGKRLAGEVTDYMGEPHDEDRRAGEQYARRGTKPP
jgi:hypothetical protein